MAHRTDPAVLSGITTNPTCIETKTPKFITSYTNFSGGIHTCLELNEPLSYHDMYYVVSVQVRHTTAFFQIPIFLRNCHHTNRSLTSIFIPSFLNKHSSQTNKKPHCFEPCSERWYRHKQNRLLERTGLSF